MELLKTIPNIWKCYKKIIPQSTEMSSFSKMTIKRPYFSDSAVQRSLKISMEHIEQWQPEEHEEHI